MNKIKALISLFLILIFSQSAFAKELEGKWQAIFVEGAGAYHDDRPAFIEFRAGGKMNGFSGNNLFMGSYQAGKDSRFTAGGLEGGVASTRMMGRNTQYENAFKSALSMARKYDTKGDMLTLFGKGDRVLMQFKAMKEAPKKALNLAGTKWSVIYLDGAKKPFAPMGDGRVPFIEFSSPVKINGFAGDNIFNGGYDLDADGEFKVGNLAVTMMMGINGEYEYAFLQALNKTAKAEIKDAGMLCLFDKKAKLLMHLKPMQASANPKGFSPQEQNPPHNQRPSATKGNERAKPAPIIYR